MESSSRRAWWVQSLDVGRRAASQGTAACLDVGSSTAVAAAEKAATAAAQPRRKKGTRPATYTAITSAACGVEARESSIQERAAAAAKG